MAERRMFAKTIIDSDAFLDMPATAQLLYFHLAMRADDDGFVNKPKSILRTTGCRDDDLKLLFVKKFLIPFDSGIVVIKHWKIHNYIRNDRYKETKYKEEKAALSLDENNSYTIGIPTVNHLVDKMDTQDRIGQFSSKDNIFILSDSDESDTSENDAYKTIIAYLNEKVGAKYRSSSRKTRESIHARMAEGFTVDDFKTVIDKRCDEWLGTDYAQYLRPSTLFGTKFESYLNAPIKQKQPTHYGGTYL